MLIDVEWDMAVFVTRCLDVLELGLREQGLSDQEFIDRWTIATATIFRDLDRLAGNRPN